MNGVLSLSHAVRYCKCRIVWISKYRRKVLHVELRKHLGGLVEEYYEVGNLILANSIWYSSLRKSGTSEERGIENLLWPIRVGHP